MAVAIQQERALSTEALPLRRRSRLGLYAPFALLLLLAAAWSVGWFVIREKTRAGLDEWIAGEAAEGRRWSCADRTFGGYPFRIEIGCSDFTLDRPDVRASLGRLLVVSQVYSARHVIAEVAGPLRIEAGPIKADGRWTLLQASVITGERGFERISLVTDAPAISVAGVDPDVLGFTSRRFEAHLRPEPTDATAYDLAIRNEGAVIPGLDAFVGGTEPADLVLSLDVTQAKDLPARPLWSELERWRVAGGRIDLTSLTMVKGPRRAEVKGVLGLDDRHRPQGRIDIAAANLGGLAGRLAGNAGLAGLLGTLFGAPEPAPAAPAKGGAPLKPLPQLRLENGRVQIGPLPIPGLRLPSLY